MNKANKVSMCLQAMDNMRIHIAPVGYEVKRVTEPLISMHADAVYLIRHVHDNDTAAKFLDGVQSELRKKYRHIQVKELRRDLWDLYDCIECFRGIIQGGENQVYVNVSTGTKITAIAGMLSCMAWGAAPYYAPVSYPNKAVSKHSEHVMEPETLPVYSINRPRGEFMQILNMLESSGGSARKFRLIDVLENAGVIRSKSDDGSEMSAPAKHGQLRSLLDPMEKDWKFISVKASGRRSEVSVTEQGKKALKIFGTS